MRDGNGNVTGMTDPLGKTTTSVYDALDRLTRVTDPGSGITRYGYNALDQLVSVTDPRNNVTAYTIDALGNLKQQVSPDTGTTVNTFDAAGNIATSTDARGKVATYSYDALNRVTSIAWADQSIAFTYDQGLNGIGRLTGLQDASGSTNWSYDPLGRVTARTQVHAGSGATLTTGYAWSPGGRLTEVTYPSGAKIGYAFLNGRVSSVTLKGQGGAADTPILATVVYHPFGGAKSWTWGNGTAYTRTFDADGRIAAFPLASAARQVAYDLASRITGIADADPTRSFTYGYDLLDRLTSQTVGAGGSAGLNQTLAYDAVGNRTTQTLGAVSRTYTTQPTSNRLQSVSGFRTNTFDAMGNLIGDGAQTWTYDDRGRMKTNSGAAGLTTYAVNGLGQRVQKVNATLTTRYAFDEAGRLLGEYDGTGTPNQETVWLEDLPVAVLKKPPPSTDISTCYTAFAANERLEVRSGKPGAADWEWGVGANTQQSGQLATIANVNWASGVAIKFVLAYNGTGGGTITLYNSQTNAQLATTSYTNATNPLRVGNAVKLYLKSTAGIGTAMKIRATITKINQQAQSIDLETAGDNTFSEKSAYAEVIPDAGTPGMTVEGTVTLTFTGTAPPTGSRLNMTLNAGSAPCAGGGGSGGTTTASGAAQVFYVYADQIGSPRRITTSDITNKVVWAWDNLDAFGANLPDEDPDADGKAFTYNLRFPGQLFESESGVHYNYFRDFDPSTGRYVESDPIGLNGGINTYAYVRNRPLVWRDPNGLESIPMPGGGGALPGWLGDALGSAGRFCSRFPLILMATGSNRGDACSDDPGRERKECRVEKEDECQKLRERDEGACVALSGTRYGARGVGVCMTSAADRYSECLRFGPSGVKTPLAGVDTPL